MPGAASLITWKAKLPAASPFRTLRRLAIWFWILAVLPGFADVRVSPLADLPLFFEPVDQPAAWEFGFVARQGPHAVAVSRFGLEILLRDSDRLRLVWLNPGAGAPPIGIDRLPGISNYIVGDRSKWRVGVPHYSRVKVPSVYSGIDVVFYGTGTSLEYDLNVAPGADIRKLRIRVDGALQLNVDAAGDLVIRTRTGTLLHKRPHSFQTSHGKKSELPSRYRIVGRNVVGFEVDGIDKTRPLTIDPVLSFSTYFGGAYSDSATAIAVDNSQNVYITGTTQSVDFPVESAAQGFKKGIAPPSVYATYDAFVAKIDTTTRTVVYSTYLGSSEDDVGRSIAVDSAGNAYVTGIAGAADFPLVNPIRSAFSGGEAFVTKLDPAGTPVYSTFLGGSAVDEGKSIYVSGSGSAYIAGSTTSSDFPAVNAYQAPHSGSSDCFVAKLNPAGTALEFSSVFGGSGEDVVNQISLDPSRNILLTGTTLSLDFPVLNPFQAAPAPPHTITSAFVMKMNAAASSLVYSSYLGVSASAPEFNGSTYGLAITADSSGNAYVVGRTDSQTFPLLNPLQSTVGRIDCFLTRITATGALAFSTLIGSGSSEECGSVALDGAGRIWVAGESSEADFPLVDAIQTTMSNWGTNILLQVAGDGSAILFSTFLGTQEGQISPGGLAVDSSGNAYLAGSVWASGFPTAQPIQSYRGSGDVFLSKITGQTQCTYAVSPLVPPTLPPEGGSSSVTVTTQAGCQWNAVSHNLVSIAGPNTGPGGGSGYGTWYEAVGPNQVDYSVPYAQGPDRTLDIIVAGKKVTIHQQGNGCNPEMYFPESSIPAGGGNGHFEIADRSGCPYRAASNASWIVLQPPTSGTSGGIVNFSVGPNNTCAERQGTISVGALTHTVTQPALGCGVPAPTTTTLVPTPNPSVLGHSVTLTATVSPSLATGQVSFLDGATMLGVGTLTSGTATFATSSLPAGSRSLRASYGGDASYQASTSVWVTQTVSRSDTTTTTLVATPSPSALGQTVTLTATVSPSAAAGQVTFYDGTTVLGVGTLASGTATLTTSLLPSGSRSLRAYYGGDAGYLASASGWVTQPVTVSSTTTTTLFVTPNPSVLGQPLTLTASVSPSAATGQVTFYDGTTVLGVGILANGTATFATSSLPAGGRSLRAYYGGDVVYPASTSGWVTQTVSASRTTTVVLAATPNPSAVGQLVTLTATASPSAATGQVTFLDGTTVLGVGSLAGGTATFATSSLPVGSRSLRAYYGGDAVYGTSTSGWVTQMTASTTPGLHYLGSMAQLASGNYWTTTITLVNHGTAAARARLNFFNNSGGPLSLPITYLSLPPAEPVLLSSVERTIEPGASFSFSITGPENVETVGWAQMLTDGDISGFAVFRQKVHREQEAVVPLEIHNSDSYVLWFNNSGDFITGVAVANNSTSAASIPVIVRDEAGNQIHTQTLELPGLGHISGALTAIINNTGGKVGSVEFHTPQGGQISVLGLRFNGISFTTTPVLDRSLQSGTAPLSSQIPAGSAAQIASGHYWETTITLVNKGNSLARAKVDFFDDQGNPLVLPVTFPASPGVPAVMTPTLERTLVPGASLSLSSTGPVDIETVGWARLSSDGDVGGFAIYHQDVDGAQEALVPMEIGNPDAWLMWFDNSGTFASGLAVVNNATTPASIPVVVRDEVGTEIYTQTVPLAGLCHTSGAMTNMIGNTLGKAGSVEFRTPPGGAITVLGLRFNGVSFTTIPVMPIYR